MGFHMFACGSPGYHFDKDMLDGDDFDTVKLLAAFQFTSPTKVDVGGTVAGIVVPSADLTDAAQAYGVIQLGGLLKEAVDYLAMCSGAGVGWISVSVRTTHQFWPDKVGFARYGFTPNDNPGAEFMRLITTPLRDNSLNTLGVLNALVVVLGSYGNLIGLSGTPIINIQISH